MQSIVALNGHTMNMPAQFSHKLGQLCNLRTLIYYCKELKILTTVCQAGIEFLNYFSYQSTLLFQRLIEKK